MKKTYYGLALGALIGALVMLYAQADMELDSSAEIDEETASLATFAGGCFWCIESDFEKLPGVIRVISGYTGGEKESPTYREVLMAI